jgi:hypothetical protein
MHLDRIVDLLSSGASQLDADHWLAARDEVLGAVRRIAVTRHPLGFIHFDLSPLVNLPSGSSLRLHSWDAGKHFVDAAGSLHDHTWDLTSWVIEGEIRNTTFLPRFDPMGAYSAAQVEYGEVNEFRSVGRYSLDNGVSQNYQSGTVYRMPSRVVHNSELISVRATTLVLSDQGAGFAQAGPIILSRDKDPSEGTAVRHKLPSAEAWEHLHHLFTRVEDACS